MSTKRKAPGRISQPVIKQSAKKQLRTHINEADTAVTGVDTDANAKGEGIIEISSDEGSSKYDFSDEEEGKPAGEAPAKRIGSQKLNSASKNAPTIPTNGDVDTDMQSPKPATDGDSDQEAAEPTFGERLHAEETIDVPSAFLALQPSATTTAGKVLAPPSLASLGTALSQALRTDDADLLESCLRTTDANTIRSTVQRLDSSLAGILLTKLASRMHRRPGRAGTLLIWVQWTLVTHGGALATQPNLTKKLGELHRVMEERTRGLSSLLSLKGKLDLLVQQMKLRQMMQYSNEEEDDEKEQGVVYVEGEENDDDMDDGVMDVDDEEELANGVGENDSEDDEDSSDDEGADALEAVEDDMDENEVDYSDNDSVDDEDSEVDAAPPAKKGRR
ncbi:U3 small nucleolar RNA-associated protein 6 [Apiospora saccharicola]|uniref:U3 small nucleolar RNA-associated protein 6 n=1 Tax=Apiospora saccharicola TaxID=335842 RepID=A0ABR1W646_9PEZI